MSELSIDIKKTTTAEVAQKMEEVNLKEDDSLKQWEKLDSEYRQSVESIVTEMLLGLTRNFNWLPNAIKFMPEEGDEERTCIEIRFSLLFNEIVEAARKAEQDRIETAKEVRHDMIELQNQIREKK